MKNQIYSITGGLQAIINNIEDESFSSIELQNSSCPEWAADMAISNSQAWFRIDYEESFMRELENELEGKASFSISKMGDSVLLDIIA